MKLLCIIIFVLFFNQIKCHKPGNDSFINGKNLFIEKLSNCKVKLDDGSIIDLSSLNNSANPMYFIK